MKGKELNQTCVCRTFATMKGILKHFVREHKHLQTMQKGTKGHYRNQAKAHFHSFCLFTIKKYLHYIKKLEEKIIQVIMPP